MNTPQPNQPPPDAPSHDTKLRSDVQYSGRTRMARVFSACHDGVVGHPCQVEVCLMQGLPSFEIIGSADATLRGVGQRVKPALRMAGFGFPDTRITVNINPAWLPKRGTAFDLPIALGILMATGQLRPQVPVAAFGELGLDAYLHPVPGAFVMAHTLMDRVRIPTLIPLGNRTEVTRWYGEGTIACRNLEDAIRYLQFGAMPRLSAPDVPLPPEPVIPDLSRIRGQMMAVEALKIAAVGGHHMLMVGSSGCGKSMLAACMPGILPDLSPDERREVAAIYSVSGRLLDDMPDFTRPVMRQPHFSTTKPALFGGGRYPLPGELSLAHCGGLFLDEINRFDGQVIAQLLDPLDHGQIRVTRLRQQVMYPARFQLLAAANPCPCGKQLEEGCRCPEGEILRYRRKLITPFLDRFDLQVGMRKLDAADLGQTVTGAHDRVSPGVREKVTEARALQYRRHLAAGLGRILNSQVPGDRMAEVWGIEAPLIGYSESVADQLGLSVRGYQKLWRVARSVADFDGRDTLTRTDVDLALHFRSVYREEATHAQ